MASPAKRLPSVSCSANPMTTAPTGRRRATIAIRHEQRRHEHEQRDDDGVLDDLRVVVRNPVDAPRVDGEDDERVRDAEGEQQRAGDADLAADRCRQPAVGDAAPRQWCRRAGAATRVRQPAADVGVHRGPARVAARRPAGRRRSMIGATTIRSSRGNERRPSAGDYQRFGAEVRPSPASPIASQT